MQNLRPMKILAPLAREGKINHDASIRDSQSTIINAPIEEVWSALIDIEKWPEWNQEIRSTKISGLEAGNTFEWQYFGNHYKSTIQRVKTNELISWTTAAMGLKSIHVWKLEETEGKQTIVLTEMSAEGFFTLFHSHQKLHSTLLNWLSRLKQRAEKS